MPAHETNFFQRAGVIDRHQFALLDVHHFGEHRRAEGFPKELHRAILVTNTEQAFHFGQRVLFYRFRQRKILETQLGFNQQADHIPRPGEMDRRYLPLRVDDRRIRRAGAEIEDRQRRRTAGSG